MLGGSGGMKAYRIHYDHLAFARHLRWRNGYTQTTRGAWHVSVRGCRASLPYLAMLHSGAARETGVEDNVEVQRDRVSSVRVVEGGASFDSIIESEWWAHDPDSC